MFCSRFVKVYNILKQRDSTLKVITLKDYHSTYSQMKQTLHEALGDQITGYRSQMMSMRKNQKFGSKQTDESSSGKDRRHENDDTSNDESGYESDDSSNDKTDYEKSEDSSE